VVRFLDELSGAMDEPETEPDTAEGVHAADPAAS
jgi:hypothetical protein